MSASGTESEDDFASAESDTEVLPEVGETASPVQKSSDADTQASTSPIHSTPPLSETSPEASSAPVDGVCPQVQSVGSPDGDTAQLAAMQSSEDLPSDAGLAPTPPGTETPPLSRETRGSSSSPSGETRQQTSSKESMTGTSKAGADKPSDLTVTSTSTINELSDDASLKNDPSSGPTADTSAADHDSFRTAADQSSGPTANTSLETADSIPRHEEDKLSATVSVNEGGWGGWGRWGGSLWSSVSTVAGSAQAIGQKVTAVIASVEDTLGVPSPKELAEQETEEQQLDQEVRRLADEIKEHDPSPDRFEDPAIAGEPAENTEQSSSGGGVTGFLSGFAAAVQSTSHGLVSGGLDALETIGKKTMEVLSEGDPGLVKKRAMLGVGSSPTLSQLLKEAKSEAAAPRDEELDSVPLNYSRLFEEYHGVDHLEALELLSRECAGKVHSVSGNMGGGDLQTLQEVFAKLSECFTIDEDQENLEDDSSQLGEVQELFSSMTVPFKVDKLMRVSSCWRDKVLALSGGDEEGEGVLGEEGKEVGQESQDSIEEQPEEKESHKKAISETLYENGLRSLAEMTSIAIELFRKMAEMSLLPDITQSEPFSQAHRFNRLTVLVSNELDALASVHSEAITQLDLEGTTSSVTSLYLESSNSGSYVQDAFQLLLPVLKLSAAQQLKVSPQTPGTLSRN